MSCAKRQLHCSERPPRTQRFTIFAISRAPSFAVAATIHNLRDLTVAITSQQRAARSVSCSERPPRTQRSAIFAISRAPSHRSNELREASAPLQRATVAKATIYDLGDLMAP